MDGNKNWGNAKNSDDIKVPGWSNPEESGDKEKMSVPEKPDNWVDKDSIDTAIVHEESNPASNRPDDNNIKNTAAESENSSLINDQKGDALLVNETKIDVRDGHKNEVIGDDERAVVQDEKGDELFAEDATAIDKSQDGEVAIEDMIGTELDGANGHKTTTMSEIETYGEVDVNGMESEKKIDTDASTQANAGPKDNAWTQAANQYKNPETNQSNMGKPKKKKKAGKIILILLLILILLTGGAFAAWFFLYYQSDNNVVTNAVTGFMNAEQKAFSSTMNLKLPANNEMGDLIQSAKLGLSGANDASGSSAEGTLTFNLGTGDEVNVVFGAALSRDDTLYIKLNGITDILKSLDSSSDLGSFINYFDDLEDQWYAIRVADLGLASEQEEILDCLFNFLNYSNSAEAGQKTADIYREHPFMEAKKESGNDKNGYAIYSVRFNEDELGDYLEAIEEMDGMADYLSCLEGLTGEDLDMKSSSGELVSQLDDMTVELHIDYWTHELKAMTLGYDGGTNQGSLSAEFGFDLSENVKVEMPVDAKSFADFKRDFEDALKAIIKTYAMSEVYALCQSATNMTEQTCVNQYSAEVDRYIEDLDLSSIWEDSDNSSQQDTPASTIF